MSATRSPSTTTLAPPLARRWILAALVAYGAARPPQGVGADAGDWKLSPYKVRVTFALDDASRPEPLLAGRRLISFSSSGAPLHWVEQTGAFGAVKTLFDQYFAELCGMHFVEHIHFGAITPGIRDDAVARFLAQARSAVSTHFGRTA